MRDLTGFATYTGSLLLVLLTGCSEGSSSYSKQEFELTAEQWARQTALLNQALEAHERGELVGARVADYKELFNLADRRMIRDRDSVTVTYAFNPRPSDLANGSFEQLPDRLKNPFAFFQGPTVADYHC